MFQYYKTAVLDREFHNKVKAETIYDLNRLTEVLNIQKSIAAYDSETTGLIYFKDEMVGFSFAFNAYHGYYVPIGHVNSDGSLANYNVDRKEAIKILYEFMLQNNILLYNSMFDLTMLQQELPLIGKNYEDIEDIQFCDVINYVYELESEIKSNGLKWSARHFLGRISPEFSQITGIKRKSKNNPIKHFGYLYPDQEIIIQPIIKEAKVDKKTGEIKKQLSEDDIQNNIDQQTIGEYIATPAIYAVHDAINTYALFELLHQVLNKYYEKFKKDNKSCSFVSQIDNGLSKAMLHYNHTPISIDAKYVEELRIESEIELEQLESQLTEMSGEVINFDSPKQKENVFKKLGINTGVKTATGQMATGIEIIEKINHPYCQALVKRQKLQKQITSYYNQLSQNNIVRINYRTTTASTGRLSSGRDDGENNYFSSMSAQVLTKLDSVMFKGTFIGEENSDCILGWKFDEVDNDYINNNPDEKYIEGFKQYRSIRNAVCSPHKIAVDYDGKLIDFQYDILSAEKYCRENNISKERIQYERNNDWYILGIDYQSEEIKLMGNLSLEPAFIEPFLIGSDVHTEMAKKLAIALRQMWDNLSPIERKKLRSKAKACNFGLAYKGSHQVLLSDIPDEIEAMQVFSAWWSSVPVYKMWQDRQINNMLMLEDGTGINYFGRMRRFKEMLQRGSFFAAAAQREFANFLIQGTGADIIRLVMFHMYNRIFKKNMNINEIRFCLSIHDELCIAIRKDVFYKWIYEVIDIMENVAIPYEWPLKLTVEPQIGLAFGNGFNFKINRDKDFNVIKDYKFIPAFK